MLLLLEVNYCNYYLCINNININCKVITKLLVTDYGLYVEFSKWLTGLSKKKQTGAIMHHGKSFVQKEKAMETIQAV